MNTSVGVWIDHRKAVIVQVSDNGEEIKVIESKVGKSHGKPAAVFRSPAHHDPQPWVDDADDSRQRKLTGQLNRYYDEVILAFGNAKSILIFGPGEAKGELKKRIERDKLGEHIKAVETNDSMTDNQIAAKVREHFQK